MNHVTIENSISWTNEEFSEIVDDYLLFFNLKFMGNS